MNDTIRGARLNHVESRYGYDDDYRDLREGSWYRLREQDRASDLLERLYGAHGAPVLAIFNPWLALNPELTAHFPSPATCCPVAAAGLLAYFPAFVMLDQLMRVAQQQAMILAARAMRQAILQYFEPQATRLPPVDAGAMGDILHYLRTGRAPVARRDVDRSSAQPAQFASDRPPGSSGEAVDRLFAAITGQESNGNSRAVNPHSGALGIGQVMPANVRAWSKEVLGQSISPEEFKSNPALQEKIVRFKLNQYLQEGLRESGGNMNEAVRWAAAKWYSGRGNMKDNTRQQATGGHSYPSIASYSNQVLSRFQRVA